MSNIDEKKWQQIIKKAETIVSIVKNPQLKMIAFGKILDLLFQGRDIGTVSKPATTRIKAEKVKTRKARKGPKLFISELIDENFFKSPKNAPKILKELAERGHHLKSSDLQPYLKIFMDERRLRRKKRKPKEGGKPLWHYSNW